MQPTCACMVSGAAAHGLHWYKTFHALSYFKLLNGKELQLDTYVRRVSVENVGVGNITSPIKYYVIEPKQVFRRIFFS